MDRTPLGDRAISAERGSLFLNDIDTNELFLRITQDDTTKEIRFPNHTGIAGSVFTNSQAIIIDDAYSDERFNKEIDKQTGYVTRNIICVPIKIRNEKTIGVIQLLNKISGSFSGDDLKLLEAITSFNGSLAIYPNGKLGAAVSCWKQLRALSASFI